MIKTPAPRSLRRHCHHHRPPPILAAVLPPVSSNRHVLLQELHPVFRRTANEPLKTLSTSPEFRSTRWYFPSAPSNPVTCYCALTLASVLLYPRTLGGGAVFSGWVPFNSSFLEQVSANAKRTPILWSHGMADPTVHFEAGQGGPPLLSGAGMSCEFKAYPSLGHSINNEELKSLESWIRSRLQSSS